MNFIPPQPTRQQIDALFPLSNNPPAEGVFELGLVLGGTVSAGAFTAGVLDFLIEALDQWDLALQQKDPLAPSSRVVLKVAGGASGGGVNALILGRILPCSFPRVTTPTDSTDTGNPFFDVWVNRLDIAGMLDCGDLAENKPVESALNPAVIDNAAAALANFTGQPLGENAAAPRSRRWLEDTLSLFLTLTNLRGIPCKLDFCGGTAGIPRPGQSFVNHADFVRFELDCRAGCAAAPRPDAYGLSQWRTGEGFADWPLAMDFGMATAAFPIGFKARPLARPLSHHAWRALLVPSENGAETVRLLVPDWDALRDGDGNLSPVYHFPCVDGGVANNAPVELVRTALAGMAGRNPRDGSAANRALLMIDPFADSAAVGPDMAGGLVEELSPLAQGILWQSRYSTADLMLAADESVFSRFMITGGRGELYGAEALATAGLAGFQGFLCRDFRQHDYLLGRRNAHDFLARQLVFPETNGLFKEPFWTQNQRDAQSVMENGVRHIRLIPLLGTAASPPPLPAWPAGKLDPDALREGFQNRFRRLAAALENETLASGPGRFFLRLLNGKLSGDLTGKIIAALQASLKKSNL